MNVLFYCSFLWSEGKKANRLSLHFHAQFPLMVVLLLPMCSNVISGVLQWEGDQLCIGVDAIFSFILPSMVKNQVHHRLL